MRTFAALVAVSILSISGLIRSESVQALTFSAPKVEKAKRARVLSMNPGLNANKPLAMADYGGWTYFSDLLVGSVDEKWFAAFSLNRREYSWFLPVKGAASQAPVMIGSSLLAAFKDGTLKKIEPLSGKVLWSIELDSYVNRRISLVGNVLLVATAAQILYGIDFQTGKTEWLYDSGFPEALTVAGLSAPIAKSDAVYMGLSTGEIVSLNFAGGTERWRFNPIFSEGRFKDVVGEMALVKDRLVFTRYDGLVAAIPTSDQVGKVELLWKHLLGAISTSAYRDGRYYVGTVSGEVICFDALNGQRLWRTQLSEAISKIHVDEEAMYVSGGAGLVVSLSLKQGTILWHDQLMAQLVSDPVIVNDLIYFSTGLKNLYGYVMD